MRKIENNNELLKYAVDTGIIDLSYVQEQIEMNKRKAYLNQHPYKISEGKDGKWRTYLPDEEAGRRQIKRSTKKSLEDEIIGYYKSFEENDIFIFKNCFKHWVEKQKKYGVSNNTLQKYNSDYLRYFQNTNFENLDIRNINEEDITSFMIQRVRELNLKEKAGNSLWGYISGTFKHMRVTRKISENPCEYVEKRNFSRFYNRSRKNTSERIINNSDLKLLFEEIQDSHKKKPYYMQSYAVELAMYTGMRVGEIAALRWKNVRNDLGVIIICESEKFDRGTKDFIITSTKTGKEREFPLSEPVVGLLLEVKKVEMKYGFIGEFVFQDKNGRLHARSISHCMRYRCRKAGIDEKGIHALRRTLNSKMRCAGVSSVIAASLLGHSEQINDNNYTYDTSEMEYKKEILEKISKIV